VKLFLICMLLPLLAFAEKKSEAFIIEVRDREMKVVAPEKARPLFSVIVENRSLSDLVARFMVNDKIIKYVAVKSGQSETVEIENKTAATVIFMPVSPAFQDIELRFGKKAYEIPSKE
jgi:hypothetical protein